ncbi:hypothetical protein ACHAWF_018015 [Thalassiosira exigua]
MPLSSSAHNKSIRSYSALPDGPPLSTDASEKPPEDPPPTKEYPLSLHPYQKQKTIMGYAKKNAVVYTPTRKTVVAEYAVAKSLRDGQRVVYTSSIKTLSNQKYRDLYEDEEFEGMGLMTDDITINPLARCIVMTMEILRSMISCGSEVMCEVAWVIRRVGGVDRKDLSIVLRGVHEHSPTLLHHYTVPKGVERGCTSWLRHRRFCEASFCKAMMALQSKGGTAGVITDATTDSGRADHV